MNAEALVLRQNASVFLHTMKAKASIAWMAMRPAARQAKQDVGTMKAKASIAWMAMRPAGRQAEQDGGLLCRLSAEISEKLVVSQYLSCYNLLNYILFWENSCLG